jgi:hypothetical protein
MKVTLTAVTACELPKPFGGKLAVGESTPATNIRFKDVLSDDWLGIVRLRQQGIVTMTVQVDAVPVFDDEWFIAEMGKVRDNAAAPVTTLAALRAVPQSLRTDRQLRLVESENTLYRFDLGTLVGGEAPDDEVDGNWFNLGTVAAVWGVVGELIAMGPDVAAGAGVVSKMARIDHTHAVNTALVAAITDVAPDAVAAAGVANSYARGDHAHGIATSVTASTQAPGDVAAAGVAADVSRGDHVHAMTTGLVGELAALGPDVAAGVGAVAKFAEIAHTHAVNTALVGAVADVAAVAAAGVANSFARGDHAHAIGAGVVKSADLAVQAAVTGGIPFVVVFTLAGGGAAEGMLWNANCPMKLRFMDVGIMATVGSVGGTVTLYDDDPSGAGVPLTDAIAMDTDKAVTRLGSVEGDPTVLAGGSLWYKKNAAADGGHVTLTCVAVA